MSELKLLGVLDLGGALKLKAKKVLAKGKEILVVMETSETAHCSNAVPVIIPTPPAKPLTEGTLVWVNNSFNRTVCINKDRRVVAGGTCVQGTAGAGIWPGLLLPGSSTVRVGGVPVSVEGDQAIILANGAPVVLNVSGQG
ncbi:hypothetical protein ACO0LC_14575 [Undibacterium sp. JH2W]|uniref:hypothetical protein n=1 Tax=Undibacterium sp. JH2W TaxID=3413037 RepID=UPI003BEFA126